MAKDATQGESNPDAVAIVVVNGLTRSSGTSDFDLTAPEPVPLFDFDPSLPDSCD